MSTMDIAKELAAFEAEISEFVQDTDVSVVTEQGNGQEGPKEQKPDLVPSSSQKRSFAVTTASGASVMKFSGPVMLGTYLKLNLSVSFAFSQFSLLSPCVAIVPHLSFRRYYIYFFLLYCALISGEEQVLKKQKREENGSASSSYSSSSTTTPTTITSTAFSSTSISSLSSLPSSSFSAAATTAVAPPPGFPGISSLQQQYEHYMSSVSSSSLTATTSTVNSGLPPGFVPPHRWNQPASSQASSKVGTGLDDTAKKIIQKSDASDGKKSKHLRTAAGHVWNDPTLDDWPDNDFRVFCGDIGNEVTDSLLAKTFAHYPSFAKAKVVRDPKSGKSKGYGFLSFMDPFDCGNALRDMNGKYVGNRPITLRRSTWNKKELVNAQTKEKQVTTKKNHKY